ncbi:DUF3000 domain-containing protein [Alteromonas gracilis]
MDSGEVPAEFRDALAQIASARLRAEIRLEEMPAPQRIAPYASALAADVVVDDDEVAGGRLVVLHDPDGNDAWAGTFRCVAYVRAELDTEQAGDPVLAEVGWSWLIDALAETGADYTAPSGTVTCVSSDSFGSLADEGATAQVEIRASWTPLGDLGAHVEAWGEVMCVAAGLEPVPEGVTVLPARARFGSGRRE